MNNGLGLTIKAVFLFSTFTEADDDDAAKNHHCGKDLLPCEDVHSYCNAYRWPNMDCFLGIVS